MHRFLSTVSRPGTNLPRSVGVRLVDDPEVFRSVVERLLLQGAGVVVTPCESSTANSGGQLDGSFGSACNSGVDEPDLRVVLRSNLPSLKWVTLAECCAWLPDDASTDTRSLGLQTAPSN